MAEKSTELLIQTRPKTNRNHNNETAGGSCRDQIISSNSPATSPIWMEPTSKTHAVVKAARKVPVLYYLTRGGQLEHPHIIYVPLSSPHGLYLRDVVNMMNHHRGKGMADMYSWSFKRSYKNGYVWHDLSEDDLIQPTKGHEYVLKGSELLETHAPQTPKETNYAGENCSSTTTAEAAAVIRRRNQSWSSFDNPQEYMVVKCESSRELAAMFAADAATQTEEHRRNEHVTTASPPTSNSSSEGESGPRYVDRTASVRDGDRTAEDQHVGNGRLKASQVLMQLITCGAPSH